MRRALTAAALLALLATPSRAADVRDYAITMTLQVPRVYDNLQSQGYRKMQRQTIKGVVRVDATAMGECREPTFTAWLTNRTHRVSSGERVTYDCVTTDAMWRFIGSNKTGKFTKPCVRFSLDCNPSYNIGEDEPDNTLIVALSGYGRTDKIIRGKVAGQIGCACREYGHISPTRTITGEVDDRATVCGSFTMRLIRKESK